MSDRPMGGSGGRLPDVWRCWWQHMARREWVAALIPLSADGMILAASIALLANSRSGGLLPWALLIIGSVASLAANVSVAKPTATGRVIAA